jgi:very-short-patch-repair endonuclease
MILDELGEDIVLRHRIACGDSATFQGNERDVILLSMVADPRNKTALTAAQFEQRFNVAMSRARDRLVLVRSVQEEELNPVDLKARVIRHFRDPMAGAQAPTGDLEAMCESDFERAILRRLVGEGYRVSPQVGALGYRIDLVVEGASGRRLAIECDGDKYHGPERWADDMRRQRILERVGWRFWRCWSSSFTLDPDGCVTDLFATLDRIGVEPNRSERTAARYTLHIKAPPKTFPPTADSSDSNDTGKPAARDGIAIGDRVVIQYLDDRKQLVVTLTGDRNDSVNGFLSYASPLGAELLGKSEEDEIEITVEGRTRRVLILKVERLAKPIETRSPTPTTASKPAEATGPATKTASASATAQRPPASTTPRQPEMKFPVSDSTKLSPYSEGERIYHPKYGTGRVERIATEEVAGTRLEVIYLTFDNNSMSLMVPVAKSAAQGLRKFGLSNAR